ncbi:MAG: GNAT family N-acetyltransferase, partial [Flavobacteriaceae bacterium]
RAHKGHLNELAVLFDDYHVFYRKERTLEGAKGFLSERILKKESVIFVALLEEKLVGFTQLYPLFSSTNMMPIWLLNDLFVAKEHRGKQISKGLIKAAQEHCKITKANGISLETEKNNVPGNALYPKMGFAIDQEHNFYYWQNPTAPSS